MPYWREATYITGAALGGVGTWGVVTLWKAPPWLGFILDGFFWFCCVALAIGVTVLVAMYFNRIGTSRNSRAFLCALVLLLCTVSFPAMEQVNERLQSFADDPEKSVRHVVLSAGQFMQTAMLVLTFGVASLAANLLASTFSAIPRREE
jgi:hypothetical protein